MDAKLVRVPTGDQPGLLTPAGMRLSLGPRLREGATTVPSRQGLDRPRIVAACTAGVKVRLDPRSHAGCRGAREGRGVVPSRRVA